MNWQPIETAPRDGTDVFAHGLFTPFQGSCEFIGFNVTGFDPDEGKWLVQNHDDKGELMYWMPTHWMPLPEPPK